MYFQARVLISNIDIHEDCVKTLNVIVIAQLLL